VPFGIVVFAIALVSCDATSRRAVGSVTPVDNPGTSPDTRGTQGETHLERVARIYAQEQVDTPWARQYEYKLKEAFGMVKGTTVQRVDCRTTLCRLELEFADKVAIAQFNDEQMKVASVHPENMFDSTATVKDFNENTLKGILFVTT
jgi:hypothetical protein